MDVFAPPLPDRRAAYMADETRAMPLYAKDGSVRAHVLVDASDYEALSARTWRVVNGYAAWSPRGGTIFMHRVLLSLERGDKREGDHINLDKLDNRRANLRVVTRHEQMQNLPSFGGSSRYRGVTFCRNEKLWRAQVQVNGRKHYGGYFKNEDDAGRAAAGLRARLMPFSAEGTVAA